LSTQGPGNIQETVLFWILIPLGLLYGSLMWLRSALYRTGFLPTCHSKIPVVSVGNLAVGGTGKTPFTDYLLDYFENKGLRPAVVSRGYGGSFSGKLAVVSDGKGPVLTADYCGDEPYLLAQKHPQALVIIAPRRRDAINWINTNKNVDIIILDDAFQHLQVDRNLNVVLMDAKRPYGNGFPLPVGLLREFPGALKRADLVVLTRASEGWVDLDLQGLPIAISRHRFSSQLRALSGGQIRLDDLLGKQGVAFSGIANTEQFFDGLRGKGLTLKEGITLPDHVVYTHDVLNKLLTSGEGSDYFITTEKDATKLRADSFDRPCYVVGLNLEFIEDRNLTNLLKNLCDRIKNGNQR